MNLRLDARQRAMLAEMGVRLWLPRAGSRVAPAPVPSEAESAPRPRAVVGEAAAPRVAASPAPTSPRSVPDSAAADAGLAPLPAGIASMDWGALEAAVASCRACGLCAGRTQAVFGVGSRNAEWMVVGEAPGETEDRLGEPFVGPAGKLLDQMLAAIGLSRRVGDATNSEAARADAASASSQKTAQQGVYIANVIKCRPPGNRNPQPDEIAQCEHYLRRQVALVQPKLILAMGRFAVQALLNTSEPIGRLRGRVHRYAGVPVIVTYHPAYLLRSPAEKAKAWQDLCLARETAEKVFGD